jgi:hypothetical protein
MTNDGMKSQLQRVRRALARVDRQLEDLAGHPGAAATRTPEEDLAPRLASAQMELTRLREAVASPVWLAEQLSAHTARALEPVDRDAIAGALLRVASPVWLAQVTAEVLHELGPYDLAAFARRLDEAVAGARLLTPAAFDALLRDRGERLECLPA